MILTSDGPNRKLILTFDSGEWSVVKHLNKVYGSTFIKLQFDKFFNDRVAQRESARAEKLIVAFKNAPVSNQNQALTALGVTFDDE